jgi:hypothetical protein
VQFFPLVVQDSFQSQELGFFRNSFQDSERKHAWAPHPRLLLNLLKRIKIHSPPYVKRKKRFVPPMPPPTSIRALSCPALLPLSLATDRIFGCRIPSFFRRGAGFDLALLSLYLRSEYRSQNGPIPHSLRSSKRRRLALAIPPHSKQTAYKLCILPLTSVN